MIKSATCYALETCSLRLDVGTLFGNAPRLLWSRWVHPAEDNTLTLACRCLLVDTGDTRILFETGFEQFMQPELAARYGISGSAGALVQGINALGYAEEDIDFVVLSHLHFDHAGGLIPPWPALQSP